MKPKKIGISAVVVISMIFASNLNIAIERNSSNTSLELKTQLGSYAVAAQTQIENRYAYGYVLKTLKKRGTKGVPFKDIFDIVRDIISSEQVPAPQNFKFVSPDGAHVSWEDASRACDALKGKLIWFADQKSCL